MGLTWRDLVSSAALIAIILTFTTYKLDPSAPVISSAATASMVALVLGACCAVAAAFDLHTRPQPRLGVIYRRITTVAGTIALLAGVAGVVASSGQALEILVVTTGAVWFTGTCWHVLSIGADY